MLWAACTTQGSARLGFEPSEISTHSLCSGAAMEVYLAGVPVYNHAHWQMVERCIFALHSKTGCRVLKRHCKENDDALLFLDDPRRHILRGVKRRSLAAQPFRQCWNKEKYWTQHVTAGATTSHLHLQLINQQRRTINGGGIISPIIEGVGGGESWNKISIPNPTPPSAYLVHFF